MERKTTSSADPYGWRADIATPMSRRRLLQRGGAAAALVAAAPLIAACGGDSETTATAGGEVGGDLDLYAWQGYDAPNNFAKKWLDENGVKRTVNYISIQGDVAPRLKSPAGEGVDLSWAGSHWVESYDELGLLTPVTEKEIPNLKYLFDRFTGGPFSDGNGTFRAIPFNFGWNGLAYNEDVLGNPTSYDILFEPDLKGRVAVWDEPITNIQCVAIINGFNPDKLTHEELDEVNAWLAKLRPQVRLFSPSLGDYITALSNGDVDAVFQAWVATSTFASGDKPIKVTIPEEGALGWVDTMFIPPTADNPETGMAFANLLIGGNKVAGKTQDDVAGGVVTTKTVPYLNEQTRSLFPYDDLDSIFDEAPFAEGFPRESEEYVTWDEAVEAWEDFKAG